MFIEMFTDRAIKSRFTDLYNRSRNGFVIFRQFRRSKSLRYIFMNVLNYTFDFIRIIITHVLLRGI